MNAKNQVISDLPLLGRREKMKNLLCYWISRISRFSMLSTISQGNIFHFDFGSSPFLILR